MSRLNLILGAVAMTLLMNPNTPAGVADAKACHANVHSSAKRQVRVDGEMFPSLLAVYEDFRKNPDLAPNQRNIECYDIEIVAEGSFFTMSLIPKLPKQEGVFLVGGNAPWAMGVIYKVNPVTHQIVERYKML